MGDRSHRLQAHAVKQMKKGDLLVALFMEYKKPAPRISRDDANTSILNILEVIQPFQYTGNRCHFKKNFRHK